MRQTTELAVLVAFAALVGCSGGSSTGSVDASTDPPCVAGLTTSCAATFSPATFDTIFTNIFQPNCAVGNGTCHTSDFGAGGIVFADESVAYGTLLGADGGTPYVLPNDPGCSTLMKRLESNDPSYHMPRGPSFLSEGDRCTIVQWIGQGGTAMKRRWTGVLVAVSIVGPACAAVSCSSKSSPPAPTYFTRATLLDPDTCKKCHADHYADWSASMHAYASDDPVFRAMNQRGQRETKGALGNFCVKCHAPMAVNEGATSDGLNLDAVPTELHGVTCFFCHTVESVNGTHDNPLVLASDIAMRGEYSDPVASAAHPAAYSALHDRTQLDSARLCGACHDIVSPPGAAIERTYQDWQASLFSHADVGATCAQCHMEELPHGDGLEPIAQAPNVFARKYHVHSFLAVDQPTTPTLPAPPASETSLQQFLDTTVSTALCVVQQDGNGAIRVIVDNIAAGHSVTSGSAQDRRLWAEVIAYQGGKVVYQSGVVTPGSPVTSLTSDPDLWLIRDCMFDDAGTQVGMFWQAASVESTLIPFPTTSSSTDPAFYRTHVEQFYPRDPTATLPAMPDKVTLRLLLQPIGLDVLQDLQASGDLDGGIAGRMPTLVFPEPILTWTAATANAEYLEGATPVSCVTDTGLNVSAEKYPAVNHVKCSP